MKPVKIYTTDYCGYCVAVKRLFDAKKVPFEEIDVTGKDDMRDWLVSTTGQRTVPQVFIGDLPYGGYTDVRALERDGKLDAILKD